MKTTMKKVLAIMLAVIMVIGILPMTVSAADCTHIHHDLDGICDLCGESADYPIIEVGSEITVYLETTDNYIIYAFTPTETASYHLYSVHGENSTDTYAYVFNNNRIFDDDDSGESKNFDLTFEAEAGQVYYVGFCGYDANAYYNVYLEKVESEGDIVSDPTPEPPVNAYISEITDTTMTVAWTASPSESVVKYEIVDWDTGEVYGETSGTTYTIEGLNPNTKYYIAVCGVTATSIKSSSLVVSGTTLGSVTLYFKPNANWLREDSRFATYVFGNNKSAWIDFTELESDAGYYSAVFPDIYTGILFCRMNPATEENIWDNVWQQTVDLTIPTDGNNCLSHAEGSWSGGSGTWSYFEPTVAIETQEAASVRISATNPGLRFKTKIHKAYLEQLIEAYGAENVSVGTLITPTDILGDKDFTHELGENGVAYIDVAASVDAPFGTDGDFNVYAGSIVKIKEANLGRDFSAVGYIKIVDGDSVYYEYSENVETRNVSSIANAALEDTSAEYGEGYENKVSEGVYSPYTAAQREILEGLVAPTVIDTYEELQAAVNAGGNVTLGGDINMGNSWLDIPEGVRVTLDLAGFSLSTNDNYGINNAGYLTIKNGTLSSASNPIFVSSTSEGVKLVGNSLSLVGSEQNIYSASTNASIDLSEYQGDDLSLLFSNSDIPLESITLPEGWKLYDTNDNEITTIEVWEKIIAKPEILR